MTTLRIVQIFIVALMVVFLIFQIKDFIKNKEKVTGREIAIFQGVGFVVNFFDALGIGSFAPTLALYHLTNTVEDRKIPGTLNVGVAVVVLLEALLFIGEVRVDMFTLISVVVCSTIGSVVGVRYNERINLRTIRLVMGIGLGLATILLLCSKFNLMPVGGDAMGATGWRLIVINIFGFILGFLLPLGVGHYAPMMVVVYMLGMAPIAAFPIMMLMGGVVTAQAGFRFFKNNLFHRQAAMGQTIAGSIGVIIAVYLVKSLPLSVLQWLVIIVVAYTSVTMIRQSLKDGKESGNETAAVAAAAQE